jgi:hypothetical protein
VNRVNLRMLRNPNPPPMGCSGGATGLAAVKRQAPVAEVTVTGMTPPPRSKEGTHPGRVSRMRNTGTPTGSGLLMRAGRPTVRRAEFPGGNRMPKKPMPAGESRQETRTSWSLLQRSSRITGRIPGLVPGSRKGR